ncbi:hypothetical protein MIND_01121800 [Mycena indigotica]|uniref:DDE Tnp4 domain-containing protein n=1 Tax=Mycena indigotica TaxID=2126181 RepID=A0A8H6S626_9AGAR|nr:uncharacterized protein MIND_01121800 [Mycena indigotica]KAF7293443.1 hypothetical protein MIND_01121800 [Mycena indigotica]
MLLARLVHLSRLSDVEMQFGWERSRFSRITRLTALFLWDRWKHLLRFDPRRLTRKLAYFGTILQLRGAPMDCVVALIDGTLRKTARPVKNQRLLYNGWKRFHCLKYHALLTPDGIVVHVYGPVEGRRHDETVFQQSGLMEILQAHFYKPNGDPLFIYGDPAYSVAPHILSPYRGAALTAGEAKFNRAMSTCREPVEWSFKEVIQQFPFLDFSRNQKVLLSPCGLYYLVALLLGNAHTIVHRPQIPQFFDCDPPSLQEYFTGGPIVDEELDSWCLDSPWVELPDGDEDSPDEDDDRPDNETDDEEERD